MRPITKSVLTGAQVLRAASDTERRSGKLGKRVLRIGSLDQICNRERRVEHEVSETAVEALRDSTLPFVAQSQIQAKPVCDPPIVVQV